MAITAADIKVKFSSEGADNVAKDADSLGTKIDNVGKKTRALGTGLTAGLTVPLVGAFGAAFMGAASLEQAFGKTSAVFGEASDGVVAWSQNSAQAFGLSQSEALGMVSTYGAILNAQGVAAGTSEEYSKSLIGLAADMGAFNDVSTDRAAVALRGALTGEYEALKSLGVVMTAAEVDARALALAQADGREEITETDRVMARYALVMEKTEQQQKSFANEADGASGSMAIFKAELKDAAANIGRVLLPAGTKLIRKLTDWVRKLDDLSDTQKKWVVGIGLAAAAIGPLLIGVGYLVPLLATGVGVFAALVSPIGLVAAGLAALAVIFRDELKAALDWAVDTFGDLRESFEKFREMGVSPVQSALMALADVFPALGQVIAPLRGLVENLGDAFNALREGDYAGMFDALGAAARSLGSTILGAVRSISWSDIASALWGVITTAADWVGQQVLNIPEIALNLFWKIADGVQTAWDWIKGWIFGDGGGSGLAGDGTGGAAYGALIELGAITLAGIEWAMDAAVDFATWLYDWVKGQIDGIDWAGVGSTVGNNIRNAIRDGIQNAADLFTILLSWVSDQIRGVDWNSVGSTFAELLIAGIKGIVGLVGLAGWLLAQVAAALLEVDWGGLATAFGNLLASAITALVGFLSGFAGTLYSEITAQLGEVDWGGIGSAISGYFVDAVSGIGTAIGEAIWSELPGWLQDLISGTADFLGGGEGGNEGHTGTAPDMSDPMRPPVRTYPGTNIPIEGGFGDATLLGLASTPVANPFQPVIDGLVELSALLPPFVQGVAALMAGFSNAVTNNVTTVTDSLATVSPSISTVQTSFVTLVGAVAGLMAGFANAVTANANTAMDVLKSRASGGTASAKSSFIELVSAVAPLMAGFSNAVVNNTNTAMDTLKNRASGATSSAKTSFQLMSSGIKGSLAEVTAAVWASANGWSSTIRNAGGGLYDAGVYAGSMAGAGVAQGLLNMLGTVQIAANTIISTVDNALRSAARIASPSRLTTYVGEMLGAGLVQGIEGTYRDVARATAGLVTIPAGTTPGYAMAPTYAGGRGIVINGGIHIQQQPGQDGRALYREFITEMEADLDRVGGVR